MYSVKHIQNFLEKMFPGLTFSYWPRAYKNGTGTYPGISPSLQLMVLEFFWDPDYHIWGIWFSREGANPKTYPNWFIWGTLESPVNVG